MKKEKKIHSPRKPNSCQAAIIRGGLLPAPGPAVTFQLWLHRTSHEWAPSCGLCVEVPEEVHREAPSEVQKQQGPHHPRAGLCPCLSGEQRAAGCSELVQRACGCPQSSYPPVPCRGSKGNPRRKGCCLGVAVAPRTSPCGGLILPADLEGPV